MSMDLRTAYFTFLKRKGLYKHKHRLYRWEFTRDGGYATVLSYPKSGRSWLRFMLCEAQRLATGLPIERFIFDVPDKRRSLPKFYYVHGVSPNENLDSYYYDRIETGEPDGIVFLIRDPIRVMASFYEHLKFREFHGVTIDAELPFIDFLRDDRVGLPRYIAYLDYYSRLLERTAMPFFEVKYEDIRSRTEEVLSRILTFGGLDLPPSDIRQVVEASGFERMRSIEQNRTYKVGWLTPVRKNGEIGFKTRGGFLKDRFDSYDAAAKDFALRTMGHNPLLKRLGYVD